MVIRENLISSIGGTNFSYELFLPLFFVIQRKKIYVVWVVTCGMIDCVRVQDREGNVGVAPCRSLRVLENERGVRQ